MNVCAHIPRSREEAGHMEVAQEVLQEFLRQVERMAFLWNVNSLDCDYHRSKYFKVFNNYDFFPMHENLY